MWLTTRMPEGYPNVFSLRRVAGLEGLEPDHVWLEAGPERPGIVNEPVAEGLPLVFAVDAGQKCSARWDVTVGPP